MGLLDEAMTLEPSSLKHLDLQEIRGMTWALLREGVKSAKTPLHTPCLATLGEYGPSTRTVVLRLASEQDRLIACHSDIRSAKVMEAQKNPRASWLFYDHDRKLQLRLAGQTTVHSDDDFAGTCWAATKPMGRACYNTQTGPGRKLQSPATAPGVMSTEAEELGARKHFAVIACRIEFMDWLLLSARGHRRAQFVWRDGGWESSWVAP
jgi:3-hydroxyisobutyrate dehydrogenase